MKEHLEFGHMDENKTCFFVFFETMKVFKFVLDLFEISKKPGYF
jgi:hypothetical protein